jgi:hypothetical protein
VIARPLVGAGDVLTAARDHPYARFAVSMARIAHGLGEVSTVLGLLGRTQEISLLDGAGWLNLPRLAVDAVPDGWRHVEDWDFRWTRTAPTVQPGHERVVARLQLGDGRGDPSVLREFDLVTLGVAAENEAATRIYRRLGYRDMIAVTVLRPATPPHDHAPRSRRS